MADLPAMRELIATVAVICGGISFIIYIGLTVKWVKSSADKKIEQRVEMALNSPHQSLAGASAKDVAELVKALASLTESLVKAGPALWSLIGSALFLLIAATATGVFSGGSDRAQTEGTET